MRALLRYAPGIQHNYLVTIDDSRQPMGNNQCRSAVHELGKGALNDVLRVGIEIGGGLAEDQNTRSIAARQVCMIAEQSANRCVGKYKCEMNE